MSAFGRLIVVCLLVAGTATAHAANPCEQAAIDAERSYDLPPGLLMAIGRVESGRRDPATGRIVPWPWTIDVAGDGRMFENAAEAVRATETLRAGGARNIDVGCFQVSLLYHPDAFATMAEAFDPTTNGRYAGQLLASLKTRLGNWTDAVAAYHSADPARGQPYREKVFASWHGTLPPPLSEVAAKSGPTELAFGIKLWTPSQSGTAPSIIHVGEGKAPAAWTMPRVTSPGR